MRCVISYRLGREPKDQGRHAGSYVLEAKEVIWMDKEKELPRYERPTVTPRAMLEKFRKMAGETAKQ